MFYAILLVAHDVMLIINQWDKVKDSTRAKFILMENGLKNKRDEMLNVVGGDESYVRRIVESDIVFVRQGIYHKLYKRVLLYAVISPFIVVYSYLLCRRFTLRTRSCRIRTLQPSLVQYHGFVRKS